MAIAKLSIGEVNSGPFEAIDSLITRINTEAFSGITEMPNQADSVAADVPALVVDFNLLLDKLKAAGLMVAD
jgi:hypothetical protein